MPAIVALAFFALTEVAAGLRAVSRRGPRAVARYRELSHLTLTRGPRAPRETTAAAAAGRRLAGDGLPCLKIARASASCIAAATRPTRLVLRDRDGGGADLRYRRRGGRAWRSVPLEAINAVAVDASDPELVALGFTTFLGPQTLTFDVESSTLAAALARILDDRRGRRPAPQRPRISSGVRGAAAAATSTRIPEPHPSSRDPATY